MDMRELSYGVEIETVGRTREAVARAIQTAVGGEVRYLGSPYSFDPWQVTDSQGRIWKVVKDASLNNVPEHLRAEIVSPILNYGDMETLQQVIRAVRAAGARVDATTAIHIHVGADPFDGRSLSRLAKLVYKQEPLILTALGIRQERLSRYTKPMSPDFIARLERYRPCTKDQLNRIWYGQRNTCPQHYDSTRYYGVNFHNVWYRGTVEFRCYAQRMVMRSWDGRCACGTVFHGLSTPHNYGWRSEAMSFSGGLNLSRLSSGGVIASSTSRRSAGSACR